MTVVATSPNDKLDEAVPKILLGLFILEAVDFSCLGTFIQEELNDLFEAMMEFIEVYQDES